MITFSQIAARLKADGLSHEDTWEFLMDLKANPQWYELFEKQALKEVNKGAKRLSSKDIGEQVRKTYFIGITNTYWSYLARVFDMKNPVFGKLIEFHALGRRAA